MRQRLTERTLRRKDQGEIWDELLPGFGIRIGARRRTYFVMGRVDGKQVRRTVGTTVNLTLAQAREKARAMLAHFAAGIDPEEAARVAKLEAARTRLNSFTAVSEAYMQEHGRHRKDPAERQRKLDVNILPIIGHIPVADLKRADVKALILAKAETTPVMANRIKSLVHTVLNYGIDEELLDANPAARIKLPAEKPRDRYLSEKEIKRFWRGLDLTGLSPQIRRILKLLLVTGQRRAEVALMSWDELDFEKATWEIAAGRTKGGRATRVPLSPLALELIGAPDGASDYVFHHRGGVPVKLNSVSIGMHRELPALGLADKPATVHDLRRTFASQLAELDIDRLTISKLLNHAEQGVTGQVYELSEHWSKKVTAMEAWSNKLQEIVTGQAAPSNIEQLRPAR